MLVLGAGSAGTRHAQLLAEAGAAVTITDPDSERAAKSGLPNVPFDLDRMGGYDGIVVASPSVFHPEQTLAALATGAKVLVEKPLATETKPLDALIDAAGDRLMVGYNLRFHEPVTLLVDLVRHGRAGLVEAAHVWFGSWLPDWRPKVDYRTTYSAQRALGGGILLDAIHELDLVVWLFGDDQFTVEGAVLDHVGLLELDVEDTVSALLSRNDGTVITVSLDYLSRRYRRGVEVIGSEATARLDWSRGVIEVEDAGGVESHRADTPVSESYRKQAEYFLRFLAGEVQPPVDAAEGARSLRLAEAIRDAAR